MGEKGSMGKLDCHNLTCAWVISKQECAGVSETFKKTISRDLFQWCTAHYDHCKTIGHAIKMYFKKSMKKCTIKKNNFIKVVEKSNVLHSMLSLELQKKRWITTFKIFGIFK